MAEVVSWSLVCHQGCLKVDSGPVSVFLRSNPQGAYTTTRTANDGSKLQLWERHMRRLAQSMEVLAMAMPDRFPEPPRSFISLVDLIEPSLKVGLQRAVEMRRSGEEINVTVLALVEECPLLLTEESPSMWDMSVHLSNYTPNPTSIAHVAIMGPGRDFPLAKCSHWVTTRQTLENFKPPRVSEIILSNDGNLLLEGCLTNFFVVALNSGAPNSGTPEKWRNVEVQTAPLTAGVLPGVIRQLVIKSCQDNGIPLREVAPSWDTRGTWQEAFITSSLRMVQSVGSVQRPETRAWDMNGDSLKTCEWTKIHLETFGHVTEHIRNLLLQGVADESTPMEQFLN